MKDLFYKPLKIKGKDHEILWWGCTHIGHLCDHWENPLWNQRGFKSVQEHDRTLIDRWNSKADENTQGFLLGDVIFGYDAENRLKTFLNQLRFKDLYVMPGNHYAGWHQLFNSCETNELFLHEGKKVIFLPNYLDLFVNGQAVVAGHYPILSWNGAAKGSINLFAHVHGSLSKSDLGRLYLQKCKCLEVSVDVNPFPLTFGEIKAKLRDKEAFAPDHHTKETQNPF